MTRQDVHDFAQAFTVTLLVLAALGAPLVGYIVGWTSAGGPR